MKTVKVKVKNKGKHGGARPGSGRKKGSKDVLPRGSVKGLKTLSGLPPEAYEDDVVKGYLKLLKEVISGQHLERHIRTRLEAGERYIAMNYGKPKERKEHNLGPSLEELIVGAGDSSEGN